MTEQKLAPLNDTREATRFTQNEAKTYYCITDQTLPQWQRDFSQWAWYTQTPIAVLRPYIELNPTNALKLVHGHPIQLEPEQLAGVQKMTAVMAYLFNKGALPTKDKKSVAGVIAAGKEVIDWQAFYAWYQSQQQVAQTEGV